MTELFYMNMNMVMFFQKENNLSEGETLKGITMQHTVHSYFRKHVCFKTHMHQNFITNKKKLQILLLTFIMY